MIEYILQGLLAFLFLLLSAFFSGTENAFISLNKFKIKSLSYFKKKEVAIVNDILSDINLFFNTILLGNNFSVFAFSSIVALLFLTLDIKNASSYSSIFSTLVLIIFGEIIPKNVFRARAHFIVLKIGVVLKFFEKLFYPVTFIISFLLKGIYTLLKIDKERKLDKISKKEVFSIIRASQMEGVSLDIDTATIERIFNFSEKLVYDAVIPLSEVSIYSFSLSVKEVKKIFADKRSEYLLFHSDDNVNDIVGYSLPYDILNIENETLSIKDVMRDVVYVPEIVQLVDVIKYFNEEKIVVAIDEYGTMVGILTLSDLMDEVFGEKTNIYSVDKREKTQEGEQFEHIVVNGKTSLEQLKIDFGILFPDKDVSTIAGLIMKNLKRFPSKNDSIQIGEYMIKVLSIDKTKISKIEIRKVAKNG